MDSQKRVRGAECGEPPSKRQTVTPQRVKIAETLWALLKRVYDCKNPLSALPNTSAKRLAKEMRILLNGDYEEGRDNPTRIEMMEKMLIAIDEDGRQREQCEAREAQSAARNTTQSAAEGRPATDTRLSGMNAKQLSAVLSSIGASKLGTKAEQILRIGKYVETAAKVPKNFKSFQRRLQELAETKQYGVQGLKDDLVKWGRTLSYFCLSRGTIEDRIKQLIRATEQVSNAISVGVEYKMYST